MNPYLLIGFAVTIGALMALQGGINSRLASHLTHPVQAGWFSFLGGILIMTIALFIVNKPIPKLAKLAEIPPYLFIGGLLGSCFIMTAIYLMPRIGALTLMASLIVGQLIFSVVIDQFGLLGVPQHSINIWRVFGVLMLFGGVFLIQKF